MKICPECGAEHNRPYATCSTLCSKLRAKRRYNHKRLKEDEYREYNKAKQKEYRARREEAGLCIKCGKYPAEPGLKHCIDCLESANNK